LFTSEEKKNGLDKAKSNIYNNISILSMYSKYTTLGCT